jgi:hypothetical protein
MAKISTYPPVGTPTLSDMLIGTEVADDNATVNFTIGDILGLIGSLGLYVPYTGATSDVDLGSFLIFSGGGTFFGPVYLDDALFDGTGNSGNVGQVLSATATGTQWIDLSSLTLNLQQVLNDGNTADQNIILTGFSNLFQQTGGSAAIEQAGAFAYILQSGDSAGIQQVGNNANFIQIGTDAYIRQAGINSYIEQAGANAIIRQTGLGSAIEQTGSSAYIYQSGTNSSFQQGGANTYIEQTGANSYISQTGNNASIQQSGNNPYISQAGTTGYIKPAQIKDSTSAVGTAGQVLSSLGTGLGVKWVSPLSAVSFGSFYDSTNQTVASNTATAMKFGTDDLSGFGVSVTADGLGNRTQIEVDESGVYNVQFSAQISNGASSAVVDIWFRLNGGNIANTNTSISLQSNTNEVASWNYFIDLNPGDIFQIMWAHTNSASLAAAAAAAPHPATPSVILTVNRII